MARGQVIILSENEESRTAFMDCGSFKNWCQLYPLFDQVHHITECSPDFL